MTQVPPDIEHRLVELEIKASFSEDLVDQLNQVIVRQQAQLDVLTREVARLRQPAAGSSTETRLQSDDRPPHY